MSRIRTTLDSVTKAVGSTDLISKFSRLKPVSAAADGTNVEKALAKAETLASSNAAAALPPESTMKEEEEEEGEKNAAEKGSDKQCQQATEKPFVATKKSSLASVATASVQSSSSTVAKQTMQLFHPAGLSTANMDDTYKTLSLHINNYFGTSTQVEEGGNMPAQRDKGGDDPASEPTLSSVSQKTGDHIPILSPVAATKSIEAPTTSPPPPSPSPSENLTPPVVTPSSDIHTTENAAQPVPAPATSPKKGFTHYLSYPRPSMQAFVGSYITPLVPKFRGDSKSATADKDKTSADAVEEPTVEKAAEKTESEEEKAKQQLLTQREKVS